MEEPVTLMSFRRRFLRKMSWLEEILAKDSSAPDKTTFSCRGEGYRLPVPVADAVLLLLAYLLHMLANLPYGGPPSDRLWVGGM